MEANGIHVISTDEKSGIQAREHKNAKKGMKPGKPECVDPEYIRHGTTGLIASRNVATGEVIEPLIQPTRKEEDFAQHIRNVVGRAPEDRYCFIMDNLNTHKSEAVVRFVAELEGTDEESLGVKECSGILKSMKSREEYLRDQNHKVYIVYTPKHCSWLNQIECWFSILTRSLLNKRSSFLSTEDLEAKIKSFIDYYNKYLKKPFQWTFNGKLLHV